MAINNITIPFFRGVAIVRIATALPSERFADCRVASLLAMTVSAFFNALSWRLAPAEGRLL
jgi:hypothetical protein